MTAGDGGAKGMLHVLGRATVTTEQAYETRSNGLEASSA